MLTMARVSAYATILSGAMLSWWWWRGLLYVAIGIVLLMIAEKLDARAGI